MMNWKRSTAVSISGLILSFAIYKIVIACSDGPDPYDYYPQFFPPSVNAEPGFNTFNYTGWIKYYDEWYDRPDAAPIADLNLQAWNDYTKAGIPVADLDSFVYTYPYASLSNLYYHLEKAKPLSLEPDVAANGFTRWFLKSKDLEALGYLMYAKQCEPLVNSAGDWEAPASDTAARGKMIRNGLQLHKAAKNDAIKERYAFQVLRMAFLNEQSRRTLELYTSLVGDDKKNGSEMFLRSLGYKAGALFKLNRKTEAAYLYSIIFDNSDAMKRSAYLSFDWATTADVRPVLALCKTPHEKAVVHLMDGLNEYEEGLPKLKAAYAADPAVRGLNVLFTREINKVEERYNQDRLLAQRNLSTGMWYFDRYMGESPYQSQEEKSRRGKWKSYLPQLIAFGNQVVADGKAGKPGIWKLATGYLYLVNDEYDKAAASFANAGKGALSTEERSLQEVLGAVLLVRKSGKLDAKAEAELLPQLQRIEQRAAKDPVYAKIYRDILSTLIATAYLQNRDTVKAVYTLGRVDKQDDKFVVSSEYLDLPGSLLERMSIPKLQELQSFYENKGKSAWERWLTQNSSYTAESLKEFEGTKYIRSYQWAKAIQVLQQGVTDGDGFPSPFISQIPDLVYPDSNVRVAMYGKLQFAKEMQELQGKTDAASLFRYGCGLYNMSYYGWANRAFTYYRSTVDEQAYYDDPIRRALPKEFQEYYGVMSAEGYFKQAAASATDKELKAQALFMAAKCWQKRCPAPVGQERWQWSNDSTYYKNALKNPYFEKLRAESAGSEFYQDAKTQCSYLGDYVKRK